MKNFYVASSFSNIEAVRFVSNKLTSKGFTHTYDWTKNERAGTVDELRKIGTLEKDAVAEADFVIVLLPAGKGSHIEMGLELAHGKKVYLYSGDNEATNIETSSTFYHLPEVEVFVGTLGELVEHVTVDV